MSFSRVVSGIGRLLIGAGVLVLLFVGYQLWGTGLHEARAQDQLERDFRALVSQTTTTDPAAPATSTVAELPAEDEATSTTAPAHPVDPGEVLARIEIPRIGVDKLVVQGVTTSALRKGPGHYPTTALPGHLGNAAIAGHRTTYGAPFADIDKLAPGDDIIVSTAEGRFTYRVLPAPTNAASGHFIVKPSDVWVLDNSSDARLTLTACHPKYSAKQRIIVVAKLLEQPVSAARNGAAATPAGAAAGSGPGATTAPAAAGAEHAPAAAVVDHLGGDGNARVPMVLWGLAFFALLAAVWQAGVRWKKLPSYAIGALPLALVLFVWFEQIDRWMPAR